MVSVGDVDCAAYWGFEGGFLGFWDAFLWLVAIIFIELNIFQWHEDAGDAKPGATHDRKYPV